MELRPDVMHSGVFNKVLGVILLILGVVGLCTETSSEMRRWQVAATAIGAGMLAASFFIDWLQRVV
jgi:hypothetical protein